MQRLTIYCRLRLSEVFGSKREMPMKSSCESLFGVALAILALLTLLSVNRSWESAPPPLSEAKSSVTDLGLRVSMQR